MISQPGLGGGRRKYLCKKNNLELLNFKRRILVWEHSGRVW